MIETVKLGEIQTKVIDGVKTTDELKVLLRIGWGAETTSKLAFKPAEDLKVGDGLRVTIEKIYEVKEPEPEEVAAEEAPEPLKAEAEEEAKIGGVSEPVKMESEDKVATDEASEPLKTEAEGAGATEKI